MPPPASMKIWPRPEFIDPTKVVRTALQNAASIAGLLLTTDAAVTRCARTEERRAADAGRRRRLRLLSRSVTGIRG